jgi:hypothetical protein
MLIVKARFPAFAPDGKVVTLKQVLDRVGTQSWLWRLLDLEATSLIESNLDVIDLERMVECADGGIEIGSPGLRELAGKFNQVINIHLVAHAASGESVFVVQAFDSTEWEIWAEDSDAVAVGAFVRVRDGAQIGARHPKSGAGSAADSATTDTSEDFG